MKSAGANIFEYLSFFRLYLKDNLSMNKNQKGFVDPLSLIGIGFLVVSLIAGTVVVSKKGFNFDIRNRAEAPGSFTCGGSCGSGYYCDEWTNVCHRVYTGELKPTGTEALLINNNVVNQNRSTGNQNTCGEGIGEGKLVCQDQATIVECLSTGYYSPPRKYCPNGQRCSNGECISSGCNESNANCNFVNSGKPNPTPSIQETPIPSPTNTVAPPPTEPTGTLQPTETPPNGGACTTPNNCVYEVNCTTAPLSQYTCTAFGGTRRVCCPTGSSTTTPSVPTQTITLRPTVSETLLISKCGETGPCSSLNCPNDCPKSLESYGYCSCKSISNPTNVTCQSKSITDTSCGTRNCPANQRATIKTNESCLEEIICKNDLVCGFMNIFGLNKPASTCISGVRSCTNGVYWECVNNSLQKIKDCETGCNETTNACNDVFITQNTSTPPLGGCIGKETCTPPNTECVRSTPSSEFGVCTTPTPQITVEALGETTPYVAKLDDGTIFFSNDYQELPSNTHPPQMTTPTMIILHWDGNPDKNPDNWVTQTTYYGLEDRGTSVHFSVGANGVKQMLPMTESLVQESYGSQGRPDAINIEMAGSYFDQTPPTEKEFQNTVNLVVNLMNQYGLAPSQIFSHAQQDAVVAGNWSLACTPTAADVNCCWVDENGNTQHNGSCCCERGKPDGANSSAAFYAQIIDKITSEWENNYAK